MMNGKIIEEINNVFSNLDSYIEKIPSRTRRLVKLIKDNEPDLKFEADNLLAVVSMLEKSWKNLAEKHLDKF